MKYPEVILKLPEWVEPFLESWQGGTESPQGRMELVLGLTRENVVQGGGPFGAAVFDAESGVLLAPGVNQVLALSSSIAHAEIMALTIAQQKLQTFDLGAPGLPVCELVSSTAPCAMCLGAIPWSGVRRLICGARDEDAREIGFDEGAKIENWIEELEKRGISVITDLCRTEAREVLLAYRDAGGTIYNSRSA